jgi:hypothetical protein
MNEERERYYTVFELPTYSEEVCLHNLRIKLIHFIKSSLIFDPASMAPFDDQIGVLTTFDERLPSIKIHHRTCGTIACENSQRKEALNWNMPE